jgi:hypothetical protein
MTQVTKAYIANWDNDIHSAVEHIQRLEEKLLPFVRAVELDIDLVGAAGRIEELFSQIYEAASDLGGELSLIEDQIDECNSSPDFDLYQTADGSFYIGDP